MPSLTKSQHSSKEELYNVPCWAPWLEEASLLWKLLRDGRYHINLAQDVFRSTSVGERERDQKLS